MVFSKKIFSHVLAAAVLVGAVIAPVPTAAQVDEIIFKDVHKDTHYYEAVLNLSERGIVRGFPDGTFKPMAHVTRGQAAKMISLIVGLDTVQVKNPRFTDVAISSEYYGPIAALVEAGVVTGYEDQTFRPSKSVTRAQMAKMIHLAFELKDVKVIESPFTDVENKDWFASYVESLRIHKITTGTTATTYSPNHFVTRGQLASFINRGETVISKGDLHLTTLAGNGTFGYIDGDASTAAFRSPSGLLTLQDGSLLVTDQRNQLIRKIQSDQVSTFAGITFELDEFGVPLGGLYDGEKETAVFNEPAGLAADALGNIYVADARNNSIRKVSKDGQVTTLAGNGLIGDEDGRGEQATFYLPQAIAATSDGTLYVADTLNHLIRKITKDGEVSTLNASSLRAVEVTPGVAELAGDFQDGPLANAKFNEPSGLVLDGKGNLYVSDSGNQLIRYIDFSTNTVTTVAGKKPELTPTSLYGTGGATDGEALDASFNFPKGLALSDDGGVLIADSLNHAIRYVRNGKVWTIAKGLNHPTDVAVDKQGIIYLTDQDNQLIRQLQPKE